MMSSHFLCLLLHKLGKSKCTCDTRVNLFMNKAEQRRNTQNTTTYNTCVCQYLVHMYTVVVLPSVCSVDC